MNAKTEPLPRPEAQTDRNAPAADARPAEPPRAEAAPAEAQRFRDWALI